MVTFLFMLASMALGCEKILSIKIKIIQSHLRNQDTLIVSNHTNSASSVQNKNFGFIFQVNVNSRLKIFKKKAEL